MDKSIAEMVMLAGSPKSDSVLDPVVSFMVLKIITVDNVNESAIDNRIQANQGKRKQRFWVSKPASF